MHVTQAPPFLLLLKLCFCSHIRGTSNDVGGLEPGHDLGCELVRELVREFVYGLGLELTFWWKDVFENITMQLRSFGG